ncbi:MAG: nucleotide exchange factor GrpE [Deltaproteobacteria bacterium]
MNPNDSDEKNGPIDLSEDTENIDEDNGSTQGENDTQVDRGDDKDYQELYQKYLRLAADFENYKKRLAKEKSDIIAYGNEELIKALLNVLDNLERALEHSDVQEDPKPLLEGVKLVHKQFLSCLEKFGVQFIDASRGTEFDPRLHQAIERVVSPDITPGMVISEMLRGYMLKDRLLRPALVAVSKGPEGTGEPGSYDTGGEEPEGQEKEASDIFNLTDEES